jgi:hypothetical protein
MGAKKLKAIGQRGSWFATIDGESIPCVHDTWVVRGLGERRYLDPKCDPEGAKWIPFLAALRDGKRAILTKDGPPNENMVRDRVGYIALFSIEDIKAEIGELSFRFTNRLAELE